MAADPGHRADAGRSVRRVRRISGGADSVAAWPLLTRTVSCSF